MGIGAMQFFKAFICAPCTAHITRILQGASCICFGDYIQLKCNKYFFLFLSCSYSFGCFFIFIYFFSCVSLSPSLFRIFVVHLPSVFSGIVILSIDIEANWFSVFLRHQTFTSNQISSVCGKFHLSSWCHISIKALQWRVMHVCFVSF